MTDAQALRNIAGGIADNGSPLSWRVAFSRHQRDFQQIVNDPSRGPWNRTLSDGQVHPGHTDAYEQIVPIIVSHPLAPEYARRHEIGVMNSDIHDLVLNGIV